MIVIKRDGLKAEFDRQKIFNAVKKANDNSNSSKKMSDLSIDIIVKDVTSSLAKKKEVGVEEIQDLVVKNLKKAGFKELAKEYSDFREKRSRTRNKNSAFMKQIAVKLKATDVQYQNANVDEFSYGGRKGEASNELDRYVALNDEGIMPNWMAKLHEDNFIYLHDLDSYAIGMTNCLTIPFDHLLKYGFKVRQTDIRPAKSISTAFQQLAAIFQIQSLQQFGGCSSSHVDSTMVPYFRISFYKNYKTVCDIIPNSVKFLFVNKQWRNKDPFEGKEIDKIRDTSIDDKIYASNKYVYKKALKLTVKETNQAVESMYHNLNSLQSRSGK